MLHPSLMAADRWVLPGADLDMDFMEGRYWLGRGGPGPAALDSLITTTRSGSAWALDAGLRLMGFEADRPRFVPGRGLLIEQADDQPLLHNRDLTQADWVKSNTTVFRDQADPLGVANTACRIRADADNGTVFQQVTVTSSRRVAWCLIRRIAGSGTVEMTSNNGTNWGTLTVTSAWTKVQIVARTLTTFDVGIRLGTSGDEVAVDLVSLANCPTSPNLANPLSPIVTAGSAGSRAADDLAIQSDVVSRVLNHGGRLLGRLEVLTENLAGDCTIWQASTSSTVHVRSGVSTSSNQFTLWAGNQSTAQFNITGTAASGVVSRISLYGETNDFRAAVDGVLGTPDTSGTMPSLSSSPVAYLGRRSTGATNWLNGFLRRATFWKMTAVPPDALIRELSI